MMSRIIHYTELANIPPRLSDVLFDCIDKDHPYPLKLQNIAVSPFRAQQQQSGSSPADTNSTFDRREYRVKTSLINHAYISVTLKIEGEKNQTRSSSVHLKEVTTWRS